ncbi:MAG: hypothetical protein IIA45_15375 [Bacteroidetes bacterium]|nr:hypothetical protein [Bacteroidota bacterium]
MKQLAIILFCITIVGCSKQNIEICASPNCDIYYEIWENLFKVRNNISDAYFDNHITVTETAIHVWADGESFRVSYHVKID